MNNMVQQDQPVNMTGSLYRSVYSKVAKASLVTGVVGFILAKVMAPRLQHLTSGKMALIFIASLMVLIYATTKVVTEGQHRNLANASLWYYIIAMLMGVTLMIPFAYYSLTTIGLAFIMASFILAIMSRVGYSTKKDMISWGKTLFWLTVGLIVMSIIGIFIHLTIFAIVINVLSLILFTVYVVYDSQKVLKVGRTLTTRTDVESSSYSLALNIYLDFLNIFSSLMNLIGLSSK